MVREDSCVTTDDLRTMVCPSCRREFEGIPNPQVPPERDSCLDCTLRDLAEVEDEVVAARRRAQAIERRVPGYLPTTGDCLRRTRRTD